MDMINYDAAYANSVKISEEAETYLYVRFDWVVLQGLKSLGFDIDLQAARNVITDAINSSIIEEPSYTPKTWDDNGNR
jgi:hypothetical protein